MRQQCLDKSLRQWVRNLRLISDELASYVFCVYLESTIKRNWKGACHDLSASFHMSLLEYGVPSVLCIGVASMDGDAFDHSWVEIGGKQFDFAICNQMEKSFPPVFLSVDLDSKKPSKMVYGIPGEELDEPARTISKLTINEYQIIRPKDHFSMYRIAAELGGAIPHAEQKRLDELTLERRYGDLRRTRR